MSSIRKELLRFDLPDGGLEVVDLLMERNHQFSASEAATIRSWEADEGDLPAPLQTKLQAEMLLEGPVAETLRESYRNARTRSYMPPPAVDSAKGRWELANELPDWVTEPWRRGERWRRLAEDRIGGRALLRLESFMEMDAARTLVQEAAALDYEREDNMYATGGCHNIEEDELSRVLDPFRAGPLNTLLGDVMGESLPSRIFARAWQLEEGDRMAVHNDGIHYVATFSLGLCEDWSVARGGNIAFGLPTTDGLNVSERWMPHLGDLLLFRPTAIAWHAVEPVVDGIRRTLTGHYVSPAYPG